jgi:hypothetical protein
MVHSALETGHNLHHYAAPGETVGNLLELARRWQ